MFRQFSLVNHLLTKEGKGGRTSNSSRRLPSTLVEEIIPEDSQVAYKTKRKNDKKKKRQKKTK